MKAKSRSKTCLDYRRDLDELANTGQATDEYAEHLSRCQDCQSKMQSRVLHNLKAQPKRI